MIQPMLIFTSVNITPVISTLAIIKQVGDNKGDNCCFVFGAKKMVGRLVDVILKWLILIWLVMVYEYIGILVMVHEYIGWCFAWLFDPFRRASIHTRTDLSVWRIWVDFLTISWCLVSFIHHLLSLLRRRCQIDLDQTVGACCPADAGEQEPKRPAGCRQSCRW